MSKIIKKVVLGCDFGTGYCPIGQLVGEMTVDCDGKEMFVSVSDIGEDALYFVADHSVYNLLIDMNADIDDEVIEKWEIGSINDYEDEEEMSKSDYYNCFKYLHSIIENDNDLEEPEEYVDNYGEDIDLMANLKPFKEGNADYQYQCMCRERVALEALIKAKTVFKEMNGFDSKAAKKRVKQLKESIGDEEYYNSWRKDFLEKEYNKVCDEEWITVDYMFAGMDSYSETMPKTELAGFEQFINSCGSAFLVEVKQASKKDIINSIAMNNSH